MSARQASCPSCGAQISFRPGTFVSVCSFCSSAVARTDRDLALIGKVAPLVDTHSPLELSAEGRHQGSHFSLVGRTQLSHPAGGVWDEWYLAFDDGRWGWLAEAQGRFYLTFKKEGAGALPELETLNPGDAIELPGGRYVVNEVGAATVTAAEGELPYPFQPDESYTYADLSGPRATFATLDYSDEPPTLFLGREVTLDDLKVQPRAGYSSKPAIEAASLGCPNCGGALTLRVPDQTQRVVCPSCDGLLDVSQGNLRYLKTLPGQGKDKLYIEPGTEGTLRGTKYTAIGWMRRFCKVEGVKYAWDEYLLYNPKVGFRWLTESDGHWNFVSPLNPADVFDGSMAVTWEGRSFRKFQEVVATVEAVRGEFYWKVSVGETSIAADFVHAPQVISYEASGAVGANGGSKEINWSLGDYLDGKELWEGFKLKGDPPSPTGIAPNQPNRYTAVLKQLVPWTGGFLVALIALFLISAIATAPKTVFNHQYTLPFTTDAKGEQVVFSEPFNVPGGKGIRIEVRSSVSNSWLALGGALVSEETGAVSLFQIENSYYFGQDGGESWREGSQTAHVDLSAVPAGSYVLRLEAQWDTGQSAPSFDVTVKAGVLRMTYLLIALAVILFLPLIVLMLRGAFENRRWQESMYSTGE